MGSLLGFLLQFGGTGTARHPYRRSVAALLACVGLLLGAVSTATAQEKVHTLSVTGASLGIVESDGNLSDLRLTVNAGADQVTSTHVWAILGAAELRQRTNNGYWIPWSGNVEDLIDNRFAVDGDTIEFKIVDGSIAADNQGITIVIGYRSGGALKYGSLGIIPKGGS